LLDSRTCALPTLLGLQGRRSPSRDICRLSNLPTHHSPLSRCQPGPTYRPFSLVFHPSQTGFMSVRRHRPSLSCAPSLRRQLTSSRAPNFVSEPRTEARHPPDPRVCMSLATYLAPHASLGSAHLCAALVPALALELLATPWAATPVVSLPRCVGVPSVHFSHPHDDTHVSAASASLGRPRAPLVLACCPASAHLLCHSTYRRPILRCHCTHSASLVPVQSLPVPALQPSYVLV
jgi:hypothetical protein